jgi:outer membrane immunogenic protein
MIMKQFIRGALLIFLASSSLSHSYSQKGLNQLNVGMGVSNWGVPVYFGFDHGVEKDLTIGAEISFRSYNEDYRDNRYKHSVIGFSGNANYHFNRVLKIPKDYDFYAGLNLGFYSWSSPNDYIGTHNSGLGIGAQIGGRYFFSPRVGINLEFGGGNAFNGGKFGLTIKI